MGNPYLAPVTSPMTLSQSPRPPIPVSPNPSVNCCPVLPRLPLATFAPGRYCLPPAAFQKTDEEDKSVKQSAKEACPGYPGFNSPCVMLCGSPKWPSPCAQVCSPMCAPNGCPSICPAMCQPSCPPPCCPPIVPPMSPLCAPLCPSPCGSACQLPCQSPCDGMYPPVCRPLCPGLRPLISSMCKPSCCPPVCSSLNPCCPPPMCPPVCPKFCPPICPTLCPPLCPVPQTNLCPSLCMPAFSPSTASSPIKIVCDSPMKSSDGPSAGGKNAGKSGGMGCNFDPNCCSFDHLCSRVGFTPDRSKNGKDHSSCDHCDLCVKFFKNELCRCDICAEILKCMEKKGANSKDKFPGPDDVPDGPPEKAQAAKRKSKVNTEDSEFGPDSSVCAACDKLLAGSLLEDNLRTCLCDKCIRQYSQAIRSYLQSSLRGGVASRNTEGEQRRSISPNRSSNSSHLGDGSHGGADVGIVGGSDRDGARVKFSGVNDGGGLGGGSDGGNGSGGADDSGAAITKRASSSHGGLLAPENRRGSRSGSQLCRLCCGERTSYSREVDTGGRHVENDSSLSGGREGRADAEPSSFDFRNFANSRSGEPAGEVTPIVLHRLISEIKSLCLQGDAGQFFTPGEGDLYHHRGNLPYETKTSLHQPAAIDWHRESTDNFQHTESQRQSSVSKSPLSDEFSQTNIAPSKCRRYSSKTKVTYCQCGEDEPVITETCESEEYCREGSVCSVDVNPEKAVQPGKPLMQISCPSEEAGSEIAPYAVGGTTFRHCDTKQSSTQGDDCRMQLKTKMVLVPREDDCRWPTEIKLQIGKDVAGQHEVDTNVPFSSERPNRWYPSRAQPTDAESHQGFEANTVTIREEPSSYRRKVEKVDQYSETGDTFFQKPDYHRQTRSRVLIIPGETNLKPSTSEMQVRQEPHYKRRSETNTSNQYLESRRTPEKTSLHYCDTKQDFESENIPQPSSEGQLEEPSSIYPKDNVPRVSVTAPNTDVERKRSSIHEEASYRRSKSAEEPNMNRLGKEMVESEISTQGSDPRDSYWKVNTTQEMLSNIRYSETRAPLKGDDRLHHSNGASDRFPHTNACVEEGRISRCDCTPPPFPNAGLPFNYRNSTSCSGQRASLPRENTPCRRIDVQVQISAQQESLLPKSEVTYPSIKDKSQQSPLEREAQHPQEETCRHTQSESLIALANGEPFQGRAYPETTPRIVSKTESLRESTTPAQVSTSHSPSVVNAKKLNEAEACNPLISPTTKNFNIQNTARQDTSPQEAPDFHTSPKSQHPQEKSYPVQNWHGIVSPQRRFAISHEEEEIIIPETKHAQNQVEPYSTNPDADVMHADEKYSWPRHFDTQTSTTESTPIATLSKSVGDPCCRQYKAAIPSSLELPVQRWPDEQRPQQVDSPRHPGAAAYSGPTSPRNDMKRCVSPANRLLLPDATLSHHHYANHHHCQVPRLQIEEADVSDSAPQVSDHLTSSGPYAESNSPTHLSPEETRSPSKSRTSQHTKEASPEWENGKPVLTSDERESQQMASTLEEASRYFLSQMTGEKIPCPDGPLKFWCADEFFASSPGNRAHNTQEKRSCSSHANKSLKNAPSSHSKKNSFVCCGKTGRGTPFSNKEKSNKGGSDLPGKRTQINETLDYYKDMQCCCPCPCHCPEPESHHHRHHKDKHHATSPAKESSSKNNSKEISKKHDKKSKCCCSKHRVSPMSARSDQASPSYPPVVFDEICNS